jgi:hypothetical protein
MRRNTVKILLISGTALFLLVLLLVDFQSKPPKTVPVPLKKEISIDVTVEEKPKEQKKLKKEIKIKPAKPKPTSKLKTKTKPESKLKPLPNKPSKAPDGTKPSTDKAADGALPPFSANYRTHLGFRKYATEMYKRGARFYVLGNIKKHIYEIDFNTRSLRKSSLKNIAVQNFSSRTRVIEDEPALNFYREKAIQKHNLKNPEVILLVPKRMEDKIASGLSASGIRINEFDGFKGTYYMLSDNLTLKIHEGISLSGKQKLNIVIPL